LHPAQDDDEQPPHPDPPPDPSDDLPMPNFESCFSIFCDPHFGQTTSGVEPKTSFSNSWRHLEHWYS
jgi:hypothetical protein